MLNIDERIYLVKKVDCFALSDMRLSTLPAFFRQFQRIMTIEDIKQIADLLYLQEKNVWKVYVNNDQEF